MYDKQKAAMFSEARYSWIEASSKAGKTTGCIIWLFEEAAIGGKPGRNYWWVAPIYPQAEIAYRRMKAAIPREMYVSNETKMTIALINGATIWFKSGDNPDSLFGEDVYAAVIDECSRVKEQSWHAVRSTLTATRGKVRLIGNVKGRKNWFYKGARKAQSGESGHSFHKITASDAVAANVLDAAEINDARSVLPPAVFKELFEAEASDDEGNPFGFDSIRACVRPLSNKPSVCGGRDLAKSVDWNVGINLDRDGSVCSFERFQMPWKEATERIWQFHKRMPTAVDSTGVGDPILDALQRDPRGGLFEGYTYTSRSKQMLMENLALMIQKGEIGFPEGPIVTELEGFEYVYTRTGVQYAGADGTHDDCVNALALAALMKSKIPKAFVYEAITKVDSRNWRGQKDATLF